MAPHHREVHSAGPLPERSCSAISPPRPRNHWLWGRLGRVYWVVYCAPATFVSCPASMKHNIWRGPLRSGAVWRGAVWYAHLLTPRSTFEVVHLHLGS